MECSCHVWDGALNRYLDMLDMLKKEVCETVGPTLTASLKPLAQRNVPNLSFFHRYYFGRSSSGLAALMFHFLILVGGEPLIMMVCIIFLSPFLDVRRMSM